MCANEVVKRNISGMQVIKTLKFMLEGNYTMSELIEKLNASESESIFNNSVVSKYINTCRYCGIKIPKINNRYFVAKLPFGLNLLNEDMLLLNKLQSVSNSRFSAKSSNLLNDFMNRLNTFCNKDISRVEKATIDEVVDKFENAILEERQVMLMFRAKSTLVGRPLAIIKENNKQYVKVLSNGKVRTISLDRVNGVNIMSKIFIPEENTDNKVIFYITGPLAQRYTLRDNEEEIGRKLPEYIKIKNYGEDRKELLNRLLRYDKYCEVVSPQDFRDEMKATLRKMLMNYGEQ